MATFYSNIRTNRQYSAATGYKLSEFDALYEIFAQYYVPKSVPQDYAGEAPVLTDKREALFFVLHYLKAAPTYENLGSYFGISQASACNYVNLLKPLLHESLEELRVLPKQEIKTIEDLEAIVSKGTDIVIDVSEIRIERPDNEDIQKKNYSGKKKIIP